MSWPISNEHLAVAADKLRKKVAFACPKCKQDVEVSARYIGDRWPCPSCFKKIKIPGFDGKVVKASKATIPFYVMCGVMACWFLTMFLGAMTISDDVEKMKDGLRERGWEEIAVVTKAPLPFVLTAYAKGKRSKRGVISYDTREEYFVWFLGYRKALKEKSVPMWIKDISKPPKDAKFEANVGE